MTIERISFLNAISSKIIGAAIEVHKELGIGLLESIYEECLVIELKSMGLKVCRQVDIPILYKEQTIDKHLRIDLLVEDEIIVELKSVSEMKEVFESQLVTYLKLTGKNLGLLINFNVPLLKDGIYRKING
ncbi:MAG: GxxExxY protein [Prevotellaceae bacterium]|nr:GxxExxY protein [Candidatus Colivivens caballi]